MSIVLEYEIITPEELAEMMGWTLNRANMRLYRMHKAGWFRRRSRKVLKKNKLVSTRQKEYWPSQQLFDWFDTYPDPNIDRKTKDMLTDQALCEMD